MATTKKPKNLIAGKTMKKHYKKDGSWKIDKPNPEGYDDVSDYAAEHPEYQFQSTEGGTNPKTGKPFKYTNKYVGPTSPRRSARRATPAFTRADSWSASANAR